MPNKTVLVQATATPEFNRAVEELTDINDIVALCHNNYPEVRAVDRDGNFAANPSAVTAPQTSTPDASLPEQFMEVIYPSGNDRYEVTARSQEELDQKKRRIYAMYRK